MVIPVALTLVAIFAVGVWTTGHYTTTIANPPFEAKRKSILGLDWLNAATRDPGVTYGNEKPPTSKIDCKKNAVPCVLIALGTVAIATTALLLKCGVSAEGVDADCSSTKSDPGDKLLSKDTLTNTATATATSTPTPPTVTSTLTNTATATSTNTATPTPTNTPNSPYRRRGGGLVE